MECPVCLETIPPPAFQCCNGHILCGRCRTRADRCPVCRVGLGPRGRCLLADKLHNLLTTTLNQNKQKSAVNKKQPQNRPALYLKSRIITDCVHIPSEHNVKADNQSKPTAGTSNGNLSTEESSEIPSERTQLKENVSSPGKSTDASQIIKLETSRVLVKSKASSEENISSCNQQISARGISEQISISSIEGASPSPLRTRSLSAGQIPTANESFPGKTSCSEADGLLLHCPFPTTSEPYCCSILNGPRTLLQHLREVHQGPLVQYFLQPSSSAMKIRLPLSSSKAAAVASSSLMSFTAHDDVLFFVEVAAGATPGHRLVWLWLLGDAVQAERYRLRLTLPEGDAHTGPVFPLTASWSDVVNSNCCLNIEERRYLRGNPEVQLEILDVAKTN